MSKTKEKNCRLCLKMLDNEYNVIGESTREVFEVLLLEVDLSISEEPVVCKSCMESIQEAFVFKSICLSVDKQVESFAIERNSAELDIRDVYLNENENKNLAFSVDHNICRFCLQCQEKSNFNPLNDERKAPINEMLLKCIPELDPKIIKEPVVCIACIKSLESYYNFAMKCRNTEENIMKYSEAQAAECNRQISLSNVLKFLFENVPETAVLKEKINMFQNEGNTCSDISNALKIEEKDLGIKEEYTYGDCNSEGNRCDEISQKEVVKCDMVTHEEPSEEPMFIDKDNANVAVYQCNLCSYKSIMKKYLRKHMLTHNQSLGAVLYRCEKCTFVSKYKGSLKTHMLIHKDSSEVTLYKCKLCGYNSKWKSYLKSHMLSHKDSTNVEIYKCEVCAFETKYKYNLNKHMLVHKDNSEVTMYHCTLCNYSTKRKDNLQKHMSTHNASLDVVKYRCESCTFETKYKDYLKRHKLMHKDNSEVSMYKCNSCNYETRWKNILISHMLIHKNSSDIVTYKCDRCKYESKNEMYLKRHMIVHKDNSEVTTYKCNFCSYESKWKSTLRAHMLTHKDSSEAVMYTCELCNFKTKYKGSLSKHMLIH